MLTDVLVPVLAYPDGTDANSAPGLEVILDAFATHVTYCGVEIEAPDLSEWWARALVSPAQIKGRADHRNHRIAAGLFATSPRLNTNVSVERLTVRAPLGSYGQTVAQTARNYDLTALSLKRGSVEQAALAEDIIFGSRRPLLVAPEVIENSRDLSRIALVWEGTRTSSRALHDSMPLLQKATEVIVLAVYGATPAPMTGIEAVVGYLERHGLKPRLVEVKLDATNIGCALQDAAASEQAGMLVMGAYGPNGDNRVRELILGGPPNTGFSFGPAMTTFFSN